MMHASSSQKQKILIFLAKTFTATLLLFSECLFVCIISGRDWYHAFQKRHPDIVERIPQRFERERAQVSYDKLESWFSD